MEVNITEINCSVVQQIAQLNNCADEAALLLDDNGKAGDGNMSLYEMPWGDQVIVTKDGSFWDSEDGFALALNELSGALTTTNIHTLVEAGVLYHSEHSYQYGSILCAAARLAVQRNPDITQDALYDALWDAALGDESMRMALNEIYDDEFYVEAVVLA